MFLFELKTNTSSLELFLIYFLAFHLISICVLLFFCTSVLNVNKLDDVPTICFSELFTKTINNKLIS